MMSEMKGWPELARVRDWWSFWRGTRQRVRKGEISCEVRRGLEEANRFVTFDSLQLCCSSGCLRGFPSGEGVAAHEVAARGSPSPLR